MSSYHNWQHRPKELGGTDPLTGPWVIVINDGDTPPDQAYVELQNGWTQPTPGAGPEGDDLEDFAFRKGGINRLDFTGHLDSSGASSGDVAITLPTKYRLPKDKFFITAVWDGSDMAPAMVYITSSTGDVTITLL